MAFDPGQRERLPLGSNLVRTVGAVEMPAAGLWNIAPGWASIELCVPWIFRPAIRAQMRLKQGMIAVADDPTRSTAHFSLDAASLHSGNASRDQFLHDEVLATVRNSTIPVRVAIVEHCGGPNWMARGWITVRGAVIPLELAIAYDGVHRPGSARFQAHGTLPVRSILGSNKGLRRRLVAGRRVRIAIELHAERTQVSVDNYSR